jgi:two-component system, OmpR family, response regulator
MGRVCVVDDDLPMLKMLGRTLRDSGMDVELVATGSQALGLARGRRYDLILLDLGLPDVDGLEVLQALRTDDPDARVMVVSARDDVGNKVLCFDQGACDFIAKPFELPELLARVRAHLRPRGGDAGRGYLDVGNVRLDLVHHTLALPDRVVPLSPREFLLMRHLMTRAGETCTREELMTAVWGSASETDSNVVEVYVSRLRGKLPASLIETVRHVGYVFTAA